MGEGKVPCVVPPSPAPICHRFHTRNPPGFAEPEVGSSTSLQRTQWATLNSTRGSEFCVLPSPSTTAPPCRPCREDGLRFHPRGGFPHAGWEGSAPLGSPASVSPCAKPPPASLGLSEGAGEAQTLKGDGHGCT